MKNLSRKPAVQIRQLSLERGASLLEGIAYLGIAAIVILGAVSLLTTAFGTAQSNRSTEEVVSLRTAARKLYMGQTYPAAMAPTLINARAVPATLVIDTATNVISNSWGGAVTVAGNAGSGGVNSFAITYSAVPRDACIAMVSGATGWSQIVVDTNAALTTFPVPSNDANAVCTASTSTVVFTSS